VTNELFYSGLSDVALLAKAFEYVRDCRAIFQMARNDTVLLILF